MGSPISPIVANLYMEDFENRAIQSSPNPPLLWRRFVDDTFVIMKKCHREEFMKHLNSVDKNIQFTVEEPGPEGALPFLDILIKPDQEGRLHTTVYRKPTHTDQYLNWDSLHPVSSKYSVVGTLHHRAKTICSNHQLLKDEEEHLTKALMTVAYIVAIICIYFLQLHIIHQRPRIMIVYHMISEVIQNNLVCIIRFHGVDIPIVFQWGHQ